MHDHIGREAIAADGLQISDVHRRERDGAFPWWFGRLSASRPGNDFPSFLCKSPGRGAPDVTAARNQNARHFISGGSGNLNLAKLTRLDRPHLLQANQFEKREKRNHDFNARRHFREQLGKFQCSTLADAGQNRFDFIGDSVVLAENLLQFLPRFHSFDHVLEGVDQLKNSHLAQKERARALRGGDSAAHENIFLLERAIVQLRGGFLELFVFDQLPDQFPARIVLFRFLLGRLLIDRKQAAALDVKKVGRHDDEFAGHIDIQFLESLQVLEVLPGDALDRDVVDVELITLDQIKQEIEWALENLELN